MKIGILTFHRASNYGAVLQAYALTEVLRGLGADAQIIDYRCPEVEMCHYPSNLFKRESLPAACIHYYGKQKKFGNFEGFRQRHLHLSRRYDRETIGETCKEYDLFLSGSDQVWSKKYSGMDTTSLLDFEEDPNKKYSYAASFGFTEFPEGTQEVYARHLQQFQAVSVREQSAVDLLRSQCGLDAFLSLDPTLILGADKWMQLAKKPDIDKNYILIYRVQPPVHLIEYAKKLSAETGCEIVYLNSSYTDHKELHHARFSTPEEFVGWFANAEYVLTNSFHGTAFSIIFRRNLTVEIQTKQSLNTRSRDLLRICGLTERILPESYTDYTLGEIDWDLVSSKLETEKKSSIDYLKGLCETDYGKEACN